MADKDCCLCIVFYSMYTAMSREKIRGRADELIDADYLVRRCINFYLSEVVNTFETIYFPMGFTICTASASRRFNICKFMWDKVTFIK